MKYRTSVLVGLILFVALPILSGCKFLLWTPECEDIFQWTTKQMELAKPLRDRIDEQRPLVMVVDRATLHNRFRERSKKSEDRYRKRLLEYGKTLEEANKEIEDFVTSVAAFFYPDTNEIYINNYESDCRIKARIAHELAHFLQDKVYGKVDPTPEAAHHNGRTRREFQACKIESAYGKEFCAKEAEDWKFFPF